MMRLNRAGNLRYVGSNHALFEESRFGVLRIGANSLHLGALNHFAAA
jgi:hypothetical protein